MATWEKWEKLVERTGGFWKNYLMISTLPVIKTEYGFTLSEHLTTRRGGVFTHWQNLTAINKFADHFLKLLANKQITLTKWKKQTSQRQNKLKKITAEILLLKKNPQSFQKLISIWQSFITAYCALYPLFDFAAYADGSPRSDQTIIRLAAKIRFDCRVTYQAAESAYSILLTALAKKLKISAAALSWLTPAEMNIVFKKNIFPAKLKLTIDKRKKYCALQYKGGQVKILTDLAALRELKRVTPPKPPKNIQLKGVAAYSGQAQGPVRIVNGSADFKKIKPGDILVTPMTTAAFLPYLPKVAAIITDEGGLTCHAAIIAREFKKPCIIGTKFATKVLKNGETIEVNSKKNIIIKIQN